MKRLVFTTALIFVVAATAQAARLRYSDATLTYDRFSGSSGTAVSRTNLAIRGDFGLGANAGVEGEVSIGRSSLFPITFNGITASLAPYYMISPAFRGGAFLDYTRASTPSGSSFYLADFGLFGRYKGDNGLTLEAFLGRGENSGFLPFSNRRLAGVRGSYRFGNGLLLGAFYDHEALSFGVTTAMSQFGLSAKYKIFSGASGIPLLLSGKIGRLQTGSSTSNLVSIGLSIPLGDTVDVRPYYGRHSIITEIFGG